jgi:hypothetical protein
MTAVSLAGYLNPGPGKPRLAAVFRRTQNNKYVIVILPAFIRAYGNFDKEENQPSVNASKTIVYLSCCFSAYGNGSNRALVQAFRDVGADVVCGWDWAVEDGFARDKDTTFFHGMADTCFPDQAKALMGDLTCPDTILKRQATFQMDGDMRVMLDVLVQCKADGTPLRSRATTAAMSADGSILISGLYKKSTSGDEVAGLDVKFPGNVAGTFDCATEDNAVIYYLDDASATDYYVSRGCQGASGTINIINCASDVIIGTFTGILGHWGTEQNPQTDPPQSIMHVDSGLVKYTGKMGVSK